ncbi:hypothetical protein NIES4101_53990 [Calothrix sp. NIES-4101]|nr:hypothetical protein NIES4101_53990 [Calothrix sp. NIES-4101]
MSRFNPKGIERSAEDWEVSAIRNTDDSNLQWVTLGGIVGSVGAWVFASPLLGLVAAAATIFYLRSRIDNSGKEQELIQTYGCVAHALSPSDFLAYRMQLGDEEVANQLLFAQKHKFPIKSAGLDFLANYQPANQSETYTPTPELPQVSRQQTTTQVISSPTAEKVPDLAKELAARLKPTLIVGVPGAGKDILCWNAVEHIKRSGEAVKVFCIDPKGDRNELPYFEGRVDKLYSLDFNSAEPEECYELLQAALKEYEEDTFDGTKLLIFNELNATTKTLKRIKGAMGWLESKLTFYSSSGRSRGWVIWAISQSAHEKGLGFGGETRPIFIKVVLITLANPDAAVDILRAQIIAAEQKLPPQELKKICDRSPVGVAVYHGSLQKWFPQVKMRDFLSEAKSKVVA